MIAVFDKVAVMVMTTCCVLVSVIETVAAVPNEQQTQELLLLGALGRRAPISSPEVQGLVDMLGRSTANVHLRVK